MKKLFVYPLIVLSVFSGLSIQAADENVQTQLLCFSVDSTGRSANPADNELLDASVVIRNLGSRTDKLDLNLDSSCADLKEAIRRAGGIIFSMPNSMQVIGNRTSVQAITESQYFEKAADGRFDIRDVPWEQSPGLIIESEIRRGETPSTYQMDYTLLVRVITERKVIPGVNLEVGEPMFQEYPSRNTVSIPIGIWYLLDAFEIVDARTHTSNMLIFMVNLNPVP
ncbi:hypothetical protein JXA80_06660 [bacterium]|nr:hypothetical protein [candidate division CSSED10-310 bacterium]